MNKVLAPALLAAGMALAAANWMLQPDRALAWAAAHVPGALNLNPLLFAGSDLPKDKAAMLVFYCSNFLCGKAPTAALKARAMGYRNVHVLSAGIAGWLDARLPTESGLANDGAAIN
jgi:rhodanese-related sulfurtransferase